MMMVMVMMMTKNLCRDQYSHVPYQPCALFVTGLVMFSVCSMQLSIKQVFANTQAEVHCQMPNTSCALLNA